jgi:multiple sugar transport system substrate-binding protein
MIFMRIKKLGALLLAGIMTFSLAACGNNAANAPSTADEGTGATTDTAGTTDTTVETPTNLSGKIVVWTLANDLTQFADRMMDSNPDLEIETVVIAPADYPTKVQSALLGGETEPDVIVAEPQMLGNMYDAGFFEDLNQAPYNAQDYASQIVDYVWEVGQDDAGIQRAISYQMTPAGLFFRRDIAEEVFGTSDPAEIGKLFKDYPTILETGETLKAAGYKIFASDGEMNYFSGDSAWVVDGMLNVAQSRHDYMDLAVALYQNDLTAFAGQWSAPWYQSMSGPVPVLKASTNIWDEAAIAADAEGADTAECFAFGLPTWGALTLRDNAGDNVDNYGIASGPAFGFGGGTWIGISSRSERKELAWEFVKFCTLNEDTADWWIGASNGDVVSFIPALEKHAEDANELFGGQQTYAFWMEQAEGIDYSKVTQYDQAIGDAWGAAITAVKTGEKDKETAINDFYDVVAATYPDIIINR